MDTFNWDWGATATIIAAGVAWLISKEWKTHKSSEVIANEARSLLLLINDYDSQCLEVHSAIMNQRRAISELDSLKNLALKIRSKTQFFYELTICKHDELLELKDEITRIYKTLEKFEGMEFNNTILDNNFPYIIEVMHEAIKKPKYLLMAYFKHQK